MVITNKVIISEIKDNKQSLIDNLSKLDNIPKRKSGKSIIKISTYSYGSNGKRWYYLSKMRKMNK